MTINKSQGQSFRRVAVDLREPVFCHGQFYVAMSRVTDVHNLYILSRGLLPSNNRPPAGYRPRRVKNIVYPEVLIQYNS